MRCRICGRRLTDPASLQRGIGPVCATHLTDDGPDLFADQTTKAELPWDPRTKDIVCRRDEAGAHFNIDQVHVLHSPTGMEWGYGGSGPADFALNILNRFTDQATARDLHQRFKWDFVSVLPKDGGVISGRAIRRWIEQNTEGAA